MNTYWGPVEYFSSMAHQMYAITLAIGNVQKACPRGWEGEDQKWCWGWWGLSHKILQSFSFENLTTLMKRKREEGSIQ